MGALILPRTLLDMADWARVVSGTFLKTTMAPYFFFFSLRGTGGGGCEPRLLKGQGVKEELSRAPTAVEGRLWIYGKDGILV